MPWLPGGVPVPSVARLTGVVLGHGADRSPAGPASAARGRCELGVGAQQIGTQTVDEEDGHAAGSAQDAGQAERIGRKAPVHRHAERCRGAGQDVGERGLAVAGAGEVRSSFVGGGRRRGHGRAARTCRPVATSR